MTYRSFHLSIGFVACVVVALTVCVTYISYAQEADDQTPANEAPSDDSKQRLVNVLQEIGVEPEGESTSDSSGSWTDRFTDLFASPDEIDVSADVSETLSSTPPDPTSGTTGTVTEFEVDPIEVPSTEENESKSTGSAALGESITEITSHRDDQTHDVPHPTATQQIATPDAISLDTLLRQSSQSNYASQETFHARLEERRRLAIALRTTLEAAEQVAEFGQAGPQLLQDATLDTIVTTMVADLERERLEEDDGITPVPSATNLTFHVSTEEPISEDPTGFDAWRPVYILNDSRGNRVGWRHRVNGERLITYVGETSLFDGDTVKLVAVSNDTRGRFLVLDVNGERHEIHLF